VIGGSTGYGLATRIAAAFGYNASTVSVSYERQATETKQGTPGFYNNRAFDELSAEAGIPAFTLEGDAFSDAMKAKVISVARANTLKFDLVVYSVASGLRMDPKTGVEYRSALKPIGAPYSGKTIDFLTGALSDVTVQPATDEEVSGTVKVMGGEDWSLWIDALLEADALAQGALSVAFSYIGPSMSSAIYRSGTIGKAKEDLERTAVEIDARLRKIGGLAWVSVNKALVTRASAVIPGISVYIATLFKVMKEKGVHEGCVEQAARLLAERLYLPDGDSGERRGFEPVPVDKLGLIRLDDLEMRMDIQEEVARRFALIDASNLNRYADVEGVRSDFLAANGFALESP
jgi:enoyl-[acyl-carrier protein] reductase / trans-2-enoyl-CoA reductase (NAD+)